MQIAIIEDDQHIRTEIQAFLDSYDSFECKLAVESVEQFFRILDHSNPPDIILMDIGLPGMSGIEGTKLIKEKYPDTDIIILTVYSDTRKIFDALYAGASGYLLKNAPFPELVSSIELLYSDGAPMSPEIARRIIHFFQKKETQNSTILSLKEKEVVVGLVDGLSYKQIANRMNISIHTVRVHIRNIYKKLHVHSKADVIRKSLRQEI